MATNSMKDLLNSIPQLGKVDWIGIRPDKRGTLQVVEQVSVDIETGLIGDHYSKKGGKRMVTLIQAEHLEAVAQLLGKDNIAPQLIRRNIVVSGINLLALKDKSFQIGEVILQTTGNCHPCSRMEENLGAGGYNAMRGHGGITARVVQGGNIRIGDTVKFLAIETE